MDNSAWRAMFSSSLFRSLSARSANLSRSFHSRCDDASPDDGGFDLNSSFDRSSNAEEQPRFKQPMLYENLMGTLRQGSVNSYDGFRVIVQKQVNLNTIASHFYWIGSQSAPPIYQYRLILPFEDKSINVATDCDFNIECEVRCPLGVGVNAKSNFSIHEQQGNNLSVDIDMTDESSATQMVYSPNGNTFSMSYMQSLNNSIIIGGMGEYLGNKNALNLSFGGVYDDKENLLAAQWDTNVSEFTPHFHYYSLCSVQICTGHHSPHMYHPNRLSVTTRLINYATYEGPSIV